MNTSRMFPALIFGLGLLVAAGCSQGFRGTPDMHPACGHWEWAGSGGGFNGQRRSDPVSTGTTKSLRLYPTGEFEQYRNGELTEFGRYRIEEEESAFGSERIYFEGESGRSWSWVIVRVDSFELHLSIGAPDAGGSKYVRVG